MLSETEIAIIISVVIIITLVAIMVAIWILTILYFKRKMKNMQVSLTAPVYETMQLPPLPVQRDVEVMKTEDNVAYAQSIVPKDNDAYGKMEVLQSS